VHVQTKSNQKLEKYTWEKYAYLPRGLGRKIAGAHGSVAGPDG